jgi:hypothetical protein
MSKCVTIRTGRRSDRCTSTSERSCHECNRERDHEHVSPLEQSARAAVSRATPSTRSGSAPADSSRSRSSTPPSRLTARRFPRRPRPGVLAQDLHGRANLNERRRPVERRIVNLPGAVRESSVARLPDPPRLPLPPRVIVAAPIDHPRHKTRLNERLRGEEEALVVRRTDGRHSIAPGAHFFDRATRPGRQGRRNTRATRLVGSGSERERQDSDCNGCFQHGGREWPIRAHRASF